MTGSEATDVPLGSSRAKGDGRALARALLFALAVAANLATDRVWISGACACVGFILLCQTGALGARWLILLSPLIGGGLAIGLAWITGVECAAVERAAVRWLAGTIWAVWLSAGLSWSLLRRWLRRVRLPEPLVETLDLSVLHGAYLGLSLRRRREAALLRAGPRRVRRLLTSAQVLSGAVLRALARGDSLAETRLVRGVRAKHAPLEAAQHATHTPVAELRGVDLAGMGARLRLAHFDFRLAAGEWVALAGPSGAGKTSVLRVLAGLERPSAGSIHRFGAALSGTDPETGVDARVALVFQDPEDQFFAATARDDLLWGLEQRQVVGAAAETRAMDALAALGIAHLVDRPLPSLSFGERKRVAFAGALVTDPDLLLCDEPTMGLDPVAAETLAAALVAATAGRATAVVWATHDLDRLPLAIRRLVLLRDGGSVFDGSREHGLQLDRLRSAGLCR